MKQCPKCNLDLPSGAHFCPRCMYEYPRMASITIPDSVTSIGGSAFSGCSGLTSMNIPDSIIPIYNGEYSLDNVNWQQSYVFSGLLPGTEYTIYQRYAETSTHFVSETSEALIVKTDEQPSYIIGDVNNDNEVTDSDALYLLYHTIFGESYPIEQDCDYSNDGAVTDADALYLLYHTIFGDSYPLNYK